MRRVGAYVACNYRISRVLLSNAIAKRVKPSADRTFALSYGALIRQHQQIWQPAKLIALRLKLDSAKTCYNRGNNSGIIPSL